MRTIPVRVGDIEVLVEATQVAGSEPTARGAHVVDDVADAFARAQQTIVALATSTATTIGEAAQRGARPDHIEVEFGLKFSAQGNVVVAGASAEATLRIMLSYDASTQ